MREKQEMNHPAESGGVFNPEIVEIRQWHRDNIPMLAEYFVRQFNRKMQKETRSILKQVMVEIMESGNVQELQNFIEHAINAVNHSVGNTDEKTVAPESHPLKEQDITNLAEVEKRHIIMVLEKVNWRIDGPKGAAVLLGLHPNTLRARMQKLGIRIQKNFHNN